MASEKINIKVPPNKKAQAPKSLDAAVGKGLSPKQDLDLAQKDYANHPKFSKFKHTGVN